MRTMVSLVVIMGLCGGCKVLPRSGASMSDGGQDSLAGELLAYVPSFSHESLRHWAAALILLLVVAGCWWMIRDHSPESTE